MTESGHGVEVVKEIDGHSYELDEHALEQILTREEIKDLPVMVVSVVGAYRIGKSFLLNFFLRYLKASPSARADGSWLGGDSETLVGFPWRGGSQRMTTAFVLWSEPIVITGPIGNKVAVILIDTPGTYSPSSTIRSNTIIFNLCTLLSSVQIYNVGQNLREDDLQSLQLLAECGKTLKGQGSMAFQALQILVRDWQYVWDYPYGVNGGESLLQAKLQIKPEVPKEMQTLRKNIRSSFEKVSCFLMPHPGFKIILPKTKGHISDLSPEFRDNLKILTSSLFTPDKVVLKTGYNGEQIKCRDLLYYFKTYINALKTDSINSSEKMLELMTFEKPTYSLFNEALDIYEKGMDSVCGPAQPSMLKEELEEVHRVYRDTARICFMTKNKQSVQEVTNKYYNKLMTELNSRLLGFEQKNNLKTVAAISKAKESYAETIKNITNGQPLCVNLTNVEKVHKAGLKAAVKTFDAARRRTTLNEDYERTNLLKSFQDQYELLRQSNNTSNLAREKLNYFVCNADPDFSRGSSK